MTGGKTIYVDLDDVLCETARRFLLVIEREFGKRVAYDRLTDFDFERSCDLTPGQRAKLYEIIHFEEEILSIEPISEAIDVLNEWVGAGYEIAVQGSFNEIILGARTKSVERHLLIVEPGEHQNRDAGRDVQ